LSGQPLSIRGNLSHKWPPFSATPNMSNGEIRLTLHGSATGLATIAFGTAFLICGVGMLAFDWSHASWLLLEVWIPLLAIGFITLLVGLLCQRRSQECTVNIEQRWATISDRRWFRTRTVPLQFDAIAITQHPTELIRRGLVPSWKGWAICLWQDEQLVMVISLARDRELNDPELRRALELMHELDAGEGPVLLAHGH
jgi:hypothetical protein